MARNVVAAAMVTDDDASLRELLEGTGYYLGLVLVGPDDKIVDALEYGQVLSVDDEDVVVLHPRGSVVTLGVQR